MKKIAFNIINEKSGTMLSFFPYITEWESIDSLLLLDDFINTIKNLTLTIEDWKFNTLYIKDFDGTALVKKVSELFPYTNDMLLQSSINILKKLLLKVSGKEYNATYDNVQIEYDMIIEELLNYGFTKETLKLHTISYLEELDISPKIEL
jgi:hypothetical protein